VLSEKATLKKGAPPAQWQIMDPKVKVAVRRYPIDDKFNVYTPDMSPGWADPANAVAAPRANPTTPRPQLISFGTIGTYSVNYRNEPLPLRVAREVKGSPEATDLAFAYASMKRGDDDLNVQPMGPINPGYKPPEAFKDRPRYIFKWPQAPISLGMENFDPFTPLMRTYANDRVQVRALAGAHMNEHSFLIHGVKFLFEPSYTNSGYRNAQEISLSEHFEMEFRMPARTTTQVRPFADFLYAPSASTQGQTSGAWGILRAYDGPDKANAALHKPASPVYLKPLPNNKLGTAPKRIDFAKQFATAPAGRKQEYTVIATTAAQILPDGMLSYNIRGQSTGNYPFKAKDAGKSKLEYPYALVYVNEDDLGADGKLKKDRRVEPLILRANAGDWIKINLINQFDPAAATFQANPKGQGPILSGNPFISLAQATKQPNIALSTSTSVGLHPQLVAYDITAGDGRTVGFNPRATIPPGGFQTQYWYAGALSFDEAGELVQTPIEFGSVALVPADPLIQHRKGLIGALIVEPRGSTWPREPDQLERVPENQYVYDEGPKGDGKVTSIKQSMKKTRAVATVKRADGTEFREFVLMMQTDAYIFQNGNLLTNVGALNYRTEPLGYRFNVNSFPPSYPVGTAARLSNGLVSPQLKDMKLELADPQTPVFTAKAGTPVRFRWVYPAGAGGDAGGSSQVGTVHGHVFQEEPYVNDSKELGFNPLSQWMGGRLVVPGQTMDMLFPMAGGSFRVTGDYFYGTFIGQTSGGNPEQAIWGLFRVTR